MLSRPIRAKPVLVNAYYHVKSLILLSPSTFSQRENPTSGGLIMISVCEELEIYWADYNAKRVK